MPEMNGPLNVQNIKQSGEPEKKRTAESIKHSQKRNVLLKDNGIGTGLPGE